MIRMVVEFREQQNVDAGGQEAIVLDRRGATT